MLLNTRNKSQNKLWVFDFFGVLLQPSHFSSKLINKELLHFIEQSHVSAIVLSNSPGFLLKQYRKELSSPFQAVLSTKETGLSKSRTETYKELANQHNVLVSDVLLIDDSDLNIQTATEAGADAVLFTSNEQAIPILNSRLHDSTSL